MHSLAWPFFLAHLRRVNDTQQENETHSQRSKNYLNIRQSGATSQSGGRERYSQKDFLQRTEIRKINKMVGGSCLLEFGQRSTYSCTYQTVYGRKEGSRFPRRHLEPVTSVVKIRGCKMESFDCNFQNQIHFRVFVKFNNPSAVSRKQKMDFILSGSYK